LGVVVPFLPMRKTDFHRERLPAELGPAEEGSGEAVGEERYASLLVDVDAERGGGENGDGGGGVASDDMVERRRAQRGGGVGGVGCGVAARHRVCIQ
jgi:hypothetical protein